MKRSSFKPRDKPMARGTSKLKPVGARAKRTGQGKVAPTAEEQAWMNAIVEFGCVICVLFHGAKTPAAVHHLVADGRRRGHLYTLPLCDPGHHQSSPTPDKISRHPDKARFEAAYGTELDLLEKLRLIISAGEPCPTLPVKIPDW